MNISFKAIAVTAMSALSISAPLAASAMEVGSSSGVNTTTISGKITETSNTVLNLGKGEIYAGSLDGSLSGEGSVGAGGAGSAIGNPEGGSLGGNLQGGASGQFSINGQYETVKIDNGQMTSSSDIKGAYLSNSTTFTSSVFNNF